MKIIFLAISIKLTVNITLSTISQMTNQTGECVYHVSPNFATVSSRGTGSVFCIRRLVIKEGSLFMVRQVLSFGSDSTPIKVWILNSILLLGPSSFSRLSFFKEVCLEMNSHLERIDSFSFSYCSFQTIIIPKSVVYLGISSFIWCESLQELQFEPESRLTQIEESAFCYTSLRRIRIPSTVKIIGNASFYRSVSLEDVEFEQDSQLEEIGERAFCSIAVNRIMIPNRVLRMKRSSFSHCISLKTFQFEFESHLERIADLEFLSSGIVRIEIPKSVVVLGRMSFATCKQLEEVWFERNSRLERIEDRAFCDSSIKAIYLPNSLRFIDGSAFLRTPICGVSVESGGSIICVDSLLLDSSVGRLIRYFGSLTELVLPASIHILGRSCFACCSVEILRFEMESTFKKSKH
jgi:hypothetical protein